MQPESPDLQRESSKIQPLEGLRSKEYKFYGPSKRPTKPQYCACGMAFTTYWAHRETKQHKEAMRKWRNDSRSASTTS